MATEESTIAGIRDLLQRWLIYHRKHCDDGACAEPANALAYFAHCLGMRQEDVGQIRYYMAQYEATCPKCQHLRN